MRILSSVDFVRGRSKALHEIEFLLTRDSGAEPDDSLGLDSPKAVCTPLFQVRTDDELDEKIGMAHALLSQELEKVRPKPKRVGHLHVACELQPLKMCYAVALFMPFAE